MSSGYFPWMRWRDSWRSCASIEYIVVGRASSRGRPIGSPVSSQKPYLPSSMRCKGGFDPRQHLALAVADAQFDRILLLDGGTVVGVGFGFAIAEVVDGHARVVDQVLALLAQEVAKEGELSRVHV
jgi:hypothetical protein